MRKTLLLAAAVLGAAACGDSPTAPDVDVPDVESPEAFTPSTSIVFDVPTESPGPPFWTILANGGFLPDDGTWAAVPFLRDYTAPDCIPPGQDLAVIAGPVAFACPLTVEGHEHWQNGPGSDPAPRQTKYRGLGDVPIVFVRLSEIQPALSGGLQLAELLDLSSAIVGHASRYEETDILGVSGPLGPGRGMYKISAAGRLEDGRSFSLHVNEVLGGLKRVRIALGP